MQEIKQIIDENYEGPAIYQWRNKDTGQVYIGRATRANKRKNEHISDLKNNTHHNNRFQEDYNKLGIDGFEWSILEKVKYDDLKERERYYINDAMNKGIAYNVINNRGLDRKELEVKVKEYEEKDNIIDEIIRKLSKSIVLDCKDLGLRKGDRRVLETIEDYDTLVKRTLGNNKDKKIDCDDYGYMDSDEVNKYYRSCIDNNIDIYKNYKIKIYNNVIGQVKKRTEDLISIIDKNDDDKVKETRFNRYEGKRTVNVAFSYLTIVDGDKVNTTVAKLDLPYHIGNRND